MTEPAARWSQASILDYLTTPIRYQFVDCRWELGSPGRGRELYLASHIPGASFLDVDEDLAAPPGPGGRHPRARGRGGGAGRQPHGGPRRSRRGPTARARKRCAAIGSWHGRRSWERVTRAGDVPRRQLTKTESALRAIK